MNEHYFTCPKCGGHHFGRDIRNKEPLTTVNCHNREDGGPMLSIQEWVEQGKPDLKPCGWRGEWPEKK